MSDRPLADDDVRCVELVELITAYLDGDVDDATRQRLERHLEGCAGCRAAVQQFRTVIELAGWLRPADVAPIDPLIRDRLIAALRVPRRR